MFGFANLFIPLACIIILRFTIYNKLQANLWWSSLGNSSYLPGRHYHIWLTTVTLLVVSPSDFWLLSCTVPLLVENYSPKPANTKTRELELSFLLRANCGTGRTARHPGPNLKFVPDQRFCCCSLCPSTCLKSNVSKLLYNNRVPWSTWKMDELARSESWSLACSKKTTRRDASRAIYYQ